MVVFSREIEPQLPIRPVVAPRRPRVGRRSLWETRSAVHNRWTEVGIRAAGGSNGPVPPITFRQALDSGITRGTLRGSRYRRLFRGVYLPADEPLGLTTWVAAARLVLPPDTVATGQTALQHWGLDLGRTLPLEFVTAAAQHTSIEGIRVSSRANLTGGPWADPITAYRHLCRDRPLLDAVTIGDRLLHKRICRTDQIAELAGCGSGPVARACGLVRPGAESVRETALRLALVLAGLPEPVLNPTLRDENGFIGRVDMLLEEYQLIIEYEGDQHRQREQWGKDIDRVDRFQRLGYRVIRVTAAHFRDPWSQVLRIDRDLRERGYRGRHPRRTPGWEECLGLTSIS